jgi:hypothetical protein
LRHIAFKNDCSVGKILIFKILEINNNPKKLKRNLCKLVKQHITKIMGQKEIQAEVSANTIGNTEYPNLCSLGKVIT